MNCLVPTVIEWSTLPEIINDNDPFLMWPDTPNEYLKICNSITQKECSYLNYVLKYITNIDAQSPNGNTFIMKSILCGNIDAINILINHGAKVNVQSVGPRTKTSNLHTAIFLKNTEIIKLLCDKKANVNQKIKTCGSTPLHFAIEFDCPEMMDYMISRGAIIHAKNNFDNTLIHTLVLTKKYNKDLLEILVKLGVDLHYKNFKHLTALHMAVMYNTSMIQPLIDIGSFIHLDLIELAKKHNVLEEFEKCAFIKTETDNLIKFINKVDLPKIEEILKKTPELLQRKIKNVTILEFSKTMKNKDINQIFAKYKV